MFCVYFALATTVNTIAVEFIIQVITPSQLGLHFSYICYEVKVRTHNKIDHNYY